MGSQLLCNIDSLVQAGLVPGNINIIVDMAVIRGKMTPCHAERNIASLDRQLLNFNHIIFLLFKGYIHILTARKCFVKCFRLSIDKK